MAKEEEKTKNLLFIVEILKVLKVYQLTVNGKGAHHCYLDIRIHTSSFRRKLLLTPPFF